MTISSCNCIRRCFQCYAEIVQDEREKAISHIFALEKKIAFLDPYEFPILKATGLLDELVEEIKNTPLSKRK